MKANSIILKYQGKSDIEIEESCQRIENNYLLASETIKEDTQKSI